MTKNFQVARKWFTEHSTVSEIRLLGVRLCYGLEPVTLPEGSQTKPRAIPCGTYVLDWVWSPKHKMYVPLVKDVPGFEAVEWHIGNWGIPHKGPNGEQRPSDTEACLLVGKNYDEMSPDFVGLSSLAYTQVCSDMIKPAIKNGDTVTATYFEERS
jgi:hypothetical protein